MRKYVFCFAFNLVAMFAHGQTIVNNSSGDFHGKILNLLAENVDAINLDGDIHKGEKLRPILEDVADFLLTPILGDDPDQSRGVRDLSISCHLKSKLNFADCMISIQYKPIGETSLLFSANLDSSQQPLSVLNNRIEVIRGD